ncbi:MAG: hypothetical protein AAF443_03675 [Chlamydiota bacterium]
MEIQYNTQRKKVAQWIKKNPLITGICFAVLTAHLAFILYPKMKPYHVKPVYKPLAIRTYKPPPPPSAPPQHKKPLYSEQRAKRAQQGTPPRLKKKKPPVKRQNQQVLQEIGEALAKIAPLQSKIEPDLPLDIPNSLGTLQVDQPQTSQEQKLTEDPLIFYLKRHLKLPEYGDVTVEMTLASGKLKKMKILASESEVNASYLKHHLPLLAFPMAQEGQKTWTLTFCNED